MLTEHSEIDRRKIREILNKRDVKIYFIGIGGVSTSAIAHSLLDRNIRVFGSDRERSISIESLIKKGATISVPHSPEFLMASAPDLVVYTLAIDSENPEYLTAREMKIPCISRAELLGVIIDESRFSIGVSGSHGKSTVTAMIARIYEYTNTPATVFCGANLGDRGGYRSGGDITIYEACEYRNSFLHFSPDISVMLNLELDHTDFFRDLSELRASFVSAAALAGRAVLVSADDENLHEISVSGVPVLTFGKNERADYRYEIVAENAGKCSISIYYKGNKLTECQLAIAGKFNAANAAAAIAASHIAGVDAGVASAALASFEGIPRRLEKIAAGSAGALFYDYAHHPSEIKATIGALRDMGYERIGVIFSPHTYSRTAALWRGFSEALALADECVVTDIYAAREDPIPAVDSSRLAASVRGSGGNAVYRRASFAAEYMLGRNVDAIVIMGAGDTERVRRDMLSLFYRDS